MNTNNKIYVNADDLIFNELGTRESAIIGKAQNKLLFAGFINRAAASVVLGAAVAVGEYIGRKNQNIEYTIGKTFAVIFAAVVIFNLLSYGYVILKRKMDMYADKTEYLYCTVAEKYNKHKLSNENKKHAQNYILLETDTHHCTTAFPVNLRAFNEISVGDTVLLTKSSPFGDVHYEVFTDLSV